SRARIERAQSRARVGVGELAGGESLSLEHRDGRRSSSTRGRRGGSLNPVRLEVQTYGFRTFTLLLSPAARSRVKKSPLTKRVLKDAGPSCGDHWGTSPLPHPWILTPLPSNGAF
ncbi:hypothetical protein H1C71_013470, partial [Ictidomys tridecemlineatus]